MVSVALSHTYENGSLRPLSHWASSFHLSKVSVRAHLCRFSFNQQFDSCETATRNGSSAGSMGKHKVNGLRCTFTSSSLWSATFWGRQMQKGHLYLRSICIYTFTDFPASPSEKLTGGPDWKALMKTVHILMLRKRFLPCFGIRHDSYGLIIKGIWTSSMSVGIRIPWLGNIIYAVLNFQCFISSGPKPYLKPQLTR